MAHPFGGGSPTLREVLKRLTDLGCQIKEITGPLTLGAPFLPGRIRYVLNPANQKYVFIQNIPDDQPVGWSLLRSWERNLNVTIF